MYTKSLPLDQSVVTSFEILDSFDWLIYGKKNVEKNEELITLTLICFKSMTYIYIF